MSPTGHSIKRENLGGKRKVKDTEELPLKKVKVDLSKDKIELKKKSEDKLIDETCVASTSTGSRSKRLSTDSSASATSDNNHRRIKPSLVVKTKEPVNVENKHENVFAMFISQCLSRERTPDMHKIVEKLKRKYEQLDPDYAASEAFAELLNDKRNILMLQEDPFYIHIKEVLDEMKVRRANSRNRQPEPEAADDADEAERERYFRRERQVKKLERTMDLVQKKIKKLEEQEVDWDDEDNSTYLILERYRKRMIELYNAWCKFTDNQADAGRSYLRPKHIKLTEISKVDKAINNFVNDRLKKQSSISNQIVKHDFFPDYHDILKLIHTYNEKHNLGLTRQAEHDKGNYYCFIFF